MNGMDIDDYDEHERQNIHKFLEELSDYQYNSTNRKKLYRGTDNEEECNTYFSITNII